MYLKPVGGGFLLMEKSVPEEMKTSSPMMAIDGVVERSSQCLCPLLMSKSQVL